MKEGLIFWVNVKCTKREIEIMFTLKSVSFLVCGIPPVTHPVYVIWVGERGWEGMGNWGVGWGKRGKGGGGWHGGGLSLPEAAYTGGGRGWPQKPGGCGQTGTAAALSLSSPWSIHKHPSFLPLRICLLLTHPTFENSFLSPFILPHWYFPWESLVSCQEWGSDRSS